MKQLTTLILFFFYISSTNAQQDEFLKRFDHFRESRGNVESGLILTLPYQEMVRLESNLNSNSGLGPTFNYYGIVVVVDQMNILPNGEKQLVLRREDGLNFYGYRPTLKAVLAKNDFETQNLNTN
ncbi:hypothetical protein [Croceitalea rosinachiae]|uniref:Uncharacterized protein n=1 Tax=Croceitalea rosinachiae TaxID=3075596 RepID=A0ABU3A8V8_9FLAO|nr:hypothetical protein [Croceitalea sp. F388]MDT0606627.1 hypothetical protein [Croceitalea sp. F388]